MHYPIQVSDTTNFILISKNRTVHIIITRFPLYWRQDKGITYGMWTANNILTSSADTLP